MGAASDSFSPVVRTLEGEVLPLFHPGGETGYAVKTKLGVGPHSDQREMILQLSPIDGHGETLCTEEHCGTSHHELSVVLNTGEITTHHGPATIAGGIQELLQGPFLKHLHSRYERHQRQAEHSDPIALWDWQHHIPGDLVGYHEVYPDDWDLILAHERGNYWVVDNWCVGCACDTLVLEFQQMSNESASTKVMGSVRLNRRTLRVEEYENQEARSIWEQFRKEPEVRKRLKTRYQKMRRAALAFTQMKVEERDAVVAAPRVGRNEPCFCGSGKKFKRCCY